MAKCLYVYDKALNNISKYKIVKETPKTYKIDYQNGENVCNNKNDWVWCNKELFYKSEVDKKEISRLSEYEAATSLKFLYESIGQYLEKQKKDYITLINFLSTIK